MGREVTIVRLQCRLTRVERMMSFCGSCRGICSSLPVVENTAVLAVLAPRLVAARVLGGILQCFVGLGQRAKEVEEGCHDISSSDLETTTRVASPCFERDKGSFGEISRLRVHRS